MVLQLTPPPRGTARLGKKAVRVTWVHLASVRQTRVAGKPHLIAPLYGAPRWVCDTQVKGGSGPSPCQSPGWAPGQASVEPADSSPA